MWLTHLKQPHFIHQGIGFLSLLAWLSLGIELNVLLGPEGIYPIEVTMRLVSETHEFGTFPTHFWWDTKGHSLWLGVWIGVLTCVMAMANCFSRPALVINGFLYLSYCTVGRDFFSFQWDSLMVELCGIAALIPTHLTSHRSRWLPRLLLFKIMFFSGIAKWQSHLGDWQDGTAMTYYYETAPIPTWVGWMAHHLPTWWHHFESWWALFFELAVPFLLFGPLKIRWIAGAIFALFFVVDVATANYGFFVPQAAFLTLLCCIEPKVNDNTLKWSAVQNGLTIGGFVFISTAIGLNRFTESRIMTTITEPAQRYHLVNAYHLFGHITRERIEPVFAILQNGEWTELEFRAKPGNPMRAPRFLTPFQPRVDFRLWFYGLSYQRGSPPYVERLLERLCNAPEAIQGLFETKVHAPEAVELRFYEYRYCSPTEKAQSGCWWSRKLQNQSDSINCQIFEATH